jgi:Na+-translocating ferredoxin:NAD+ oxidoreductase RnfE subunit
MGLLIGSCLLGAGLALVARAFVLGPVSAFIVCLGLCSLFLPGVSLIDALSLSMGAVFLLQASYLFIAFLHQGLPPPRRIKRGNTLALVPARVPFPVR